MKLKYIVWPLWDEENQGLEAPSQALPNIFTAVIGM